MLQIFILLLLLATPAFANITLYQNGNPVSGGGGPQDCAVNEICRNNAGTLDGSGLTSDGTTITIADDINLTDEKSFVIFGNTANDPLFAMSGNQDTGINITAGADLTLQVDFNVKTLMRGSGFAVSTSGAYQFGNGLNLDTAGIDAEFERLGSGNVRLSPLVAGNGFLDIRNDDDATNYEGVQIGIDAANDDVEITAVEGGTGSDNLDIVITAIGTGQVRLAGGGGGTLDVTNNVTISGSLYAGAGNFFGNNGRSLLSSPSDGVMKLTANDGSTLADFNASNVLLDDLKTTGSAGSKNVVCVDPADGKLYASSTGTDCSN